MSDATVTAIPTALKKLDDHLFVCGTDNWMIECDGCSRRMPPVEDLRGEGDLGLAIARDLAAAEGWVSDVTRDRDVCPKCRKRGDE